MRIIDVLTSPWAIVPEKLLEIQEIYRVHLRGEKIDLSVVEARLGKPLSNEQKPYDVVDGVAVICMEGIVAKRMSIFTKISGGMSTYHIQEQINAAMADGDVHAIALNVDSPGGSVDGVAELADHIYRMRGKKPIVAFTDGMMASAAYWIASAADSIFISGDTAQVGSIGVVASHVDVSKAEEKYGVKTTEITAGKYKRIASRYEPLSQEGRQTIQELVDYIYTAFVGDVARHRGVSEEQVLEQMADGRLFLGRQAVTAGLVDGVSTLEQVIGKLSKEASMKVKFGHAEIDVQESTVIDSKFISQNAPEIAESFRLEGAQAERERIRGIEENALPGHEEIVAEAKKDGKSTGADVALKIVKAENEIRGKKLGDIRAEAPKPVEQPPVDGIQGPAGKVDENASVEDRAKAEWDKDEKLRAEFGGDYDAFLSYRKAEDQGRVRVLSRKR
ncbi:MAG: signal peptide peptidase SppA [Deltaproteobacteria bacterium]|nr:signal peptide peptidase SppA [Deltaproteobacteria bacterium]